MIWVTTAWAGVTGTISGVVTDPSGGVVPGAEVTVTEVATGVAQTVRTNTDGVYSFLSLPVGRYKLEVKVIGFETYLRTGITLNANDKLRFDVVLKVGQVTQQVEVTTSAVQVETANTQLGDVVNSKTMEALPLNGREFTNLLGLQPGVVPEFTASYNYNSFESTEGGNVSISGQRETANGFLINGANVDNALNNATTVIPNLDSIDEFRVLTGNFDAEYGNYSGGLIIVATKGGTNQFHGDGFEFLRNEKMDSRNFYEYNQVNPVTNQEIPSSARGRFQRNQFGSTFGGPIKQNRMFFFADYQGTRERRGSPSGLVLVPSAAERTGDFSALAAGGVLAGTVAGPYFASLLSQRLGYPVAAGESYYTSGCTTSAQCVFPNGIIPQSAFSAPSKNLMQYIPLPTEGPYFVSSANKVRTRDDRWGTRLDFNSQRVGTISGYYFFDDSSVLTPFGTNNIPGFPTVDGGRSQLINIGDTKNFGAATLNELHLSWNRHVFHNFKPAGNYPVSLGSLGFAENQPGGIVAAAPQFEGVPSIGTNNFSFGLSGVAYNRYEETPAVLDNFSKVKGQHTIKFGGQYIFNDFYEPMPLVGGNGFVSFSGTETGSDFADYLIGAPTSFVQEGGFWVDNRRNYAGLYAQDSWRARNNLTLNYGLRWDMIQFWYEKTLQSSTFVYGAQSTVYPGAPTGYVFPGDTVPGFGKIPNTIARTPYDNFGPRLGIAYSPDFSSGFLKLLTGGSSKFSVRAGVGLFYTNVEGSTMLDETGLAPFDIFYVNPEPNLFDRPYTNRTDGGTHFIPFPFTPAPRGSTTAAFWNPLLPLSGYPVPEINVTTPYSENYNFTMQRQFGDNTVLTVGYVGSQGHHLVAALDNNPGDQQLCLSLSQPSEVAPGTPTCGPFGENSVYTRPDGSLVVGTRTPYGAANFGANWYFATLANSSYNGLQASVRHTTNRLTFFASYTYAKSLDNTSALVEGVNPVNPRLSRALSAFDTTQDFVVSYQYLLPFDRLAGGRRTRLNAGWRLVGITRFATGFPITLGESDDRSLIGAITSNLDTPDFLVGNLHFTNPRSGSRYYNPELFTVDQLGHFGTADRRFFHGPGINNFDLSLQKDVRLTESKTLEFRGEFFNAFNHAQFGNPDGNVSHGICPQSPQAAAATGCTGTFGLVTSARDPRIGQVAVKFLF
jgi:carboxypeptidase family protein/TonB-dependent receptor-like protein